ncbi:hypothetical protein Syun_001245 [Stephania yunnanensis]|uniref:Glycosyl hydrolase family 63 C-terminal domain-containing protein n=1 Tax=Stephania yunnanensis TaxID=152371 RepID=A0AAP0Q6A5_9MAGN
MTSCYFHVFLGVFGQVLHLFLSSFSTKLSLWLFKTFFSGLDDYPRASHLNEDECHLDLRCWRLLAVDCLHSICELLEDRKHDGKEYHLMVELSDFEILN